MTKDQKKKRAALERRFRPPRRSIESSFSRVLRTLERKTHAGSMPLILYTDEKSDYQRALWRNEVFREKMFSGQWRHHMTNSRLGRNTRNPLFPVNYIDREIRKDMASQARETVQFPRNVSNAMLRMNLYLFDHNIFKPYRVRGGQMNNVSHSEVAGMDREVLKNIVSGFFSRRYFRPSGLWMSEGAQKTLMRDWETPLKVRPEVRKRYLVA